MMYKQFHESKAFFKGIRGNRHDTTIACYNEIDANAHNQEPFEGVRRIRVAVFQDWHLNPFISAVPMADGTESMIEFIFFPNREKEYRRLMGMEFTMAWFRNGAPDELVRTMRCRVDRYPHRKQVAPTYGCVIFSNESYDSGWWETDDIQEMITLRG